MKNNEMFIERLWRKPFHSCLNCVSGLPLLIHGTQMEEAWIFSCSQTAQLAKTRCLVAKRTKDDMQFFFVRMQMDQRIVSFLWLEIHSVRDAFRKSPVPSSGLTTKPTKENGRQCLLSSIGWKTSMLTLVVQLVANYCFCWITFQYMAKRDAHQTFLLLLWIICPQSQHLHFNRFNPA